MFVGDALELLPPELGAISSWCRANCSARGGLPKCASAAHT
jgi:hypothetical protein